MPVIDENTFADLKKMSGAEFINELIDTFLEDSPRLIEEMGNQVQSTEARAMFAGISDGNIKSRC